MNITEYGRRQCGGGCYDQLMAMFSRKLTRMLIVRRVNRGVNVLKRHLSGDSRSSDGVRMSEDAEWREKLTPDQYHVCRQKGTEQPFSGVYYKHKEPGIYTCVACQQQLFSSESKFETGCGWPSFSQPVEGGTSAAVSVEHRTDNSHGMKRIEVVCSNCKSHLGHVFPDGPPPTNTRYCINSVALNFIPKNTHK